MASLLARFEVKKKPTDLIGRSQVSNDFQTGTCLRAANFCFYKTGIVELRIVTEPVTIFLICQSFVVLVHSHYRCIEIYCQSILVCTASMSFKSQISHLERIGRHWPNWFYIRPFITNVLFLLLIISYYIRIRLNLSIPVLRMRMIPHFKIDSLFTVDPSTAWDQAQNNRFLPFYE